MLSNSGQISLSSLIRKAKKNLVELKELGLEVAMKSQIRHSGLEVLSLLYLASLL